MFPSEVPITKSLQCASLPRLSGFGSLRQSSRSDNRLSRRDLHNTIGQVVHIFNYCFFV